MEGDGGGVCVRACACGSGGGGSTRGQCATFFVVKMGTLRILAMSMMVLL